MAWDRHDPSTPLLRRRVADDQTRQELSRDPQPWGGLVWMGPLLVLAVLIVVAQVLAHALHPHGSAAVALDAVFSLVGDALLLGSAWLCARRVVVRGGGWPATLGLVTPQRADVGVCFLGIGLVFVGQLVVGNVANGVTHGRAAYEAANVQLHHARGPVLDLLILAVVVVAPVAEEVIFRGVLLRTSMRRLAFWPAAIASTVIFAGFHTYEVKTLAGAVILACGVAVLGLVNCYLVRITGRLTPGIITHAAFNLLTICVLVARGR